MLKVKDWMSTPVHSLLENESLHNARALMDLQRIRHIPIVDVDNHFSGLITHRDVLSATISELADLDAETQKEIDSGIPLREIMCTDVMTVTPDSSLKDAAQLLLNHKYGCLPVLENGQLVGILTEADFLKLTINLMDALDNDQ
ncbi:CBS domain-containing protein [Salidesulfovibrio onnuriiensis]|uniref:CBS domain-containing protein n=1 Tax=Salidesulfovibrio onnuriiensis TaxID=2583823 RepID=UPI0011C737C8|nr:CBS domain-containing protein [Salidesulfovibrio onnuriiensis]